MNTRTTEITVMPFNLDYDDPTNIRIRNLGDEEYLVICQGRFDPTAEVRLIVTQDNWPHIRAAIDTMIKLCNVPKENTEAPKGDPVFAKTDE